MLVLLFADSVKLKIDAMLSRGFCSFAKFDVFGEANAVSRCKNAIETDLLRVSDGFEVVRRERRLTAGEENDHLASWFERNGTVEDRFRVFERRFVNVANLVSVHEARIAHHVAAIGQVYSQHRAAPKLDVRGPMMMHVLSSAARKSRPKNSDSMRSRNAGSV